MAGNKKKLQKSNSKNYKAGNKSNSKLKRPSPKMLGTGMARQAAEAMLKRREELEKLMRQ